MESLVARSAYLATLNSLSTFSDEGYDKWAEQRLARFIVDYALRRGEREGGTQHMREFVAGMGKWSGYAVSFSLCSVYPVESIADLGRSMSASERHGAVR